ncbi:MAG: alginate export family protein [Flavobacteriales bacterium]|nr:alginate export family protein [Flavobacteriales bacterium]
MKTKILKCSAALIMLMFANHSLFAQFQLDAEIRPQYEFRNGYKTLFPDQVDYASFVSQRTRLISSYSTNKIKVFVSIQNIRIWGNVPQLNVNDKNGFVLHEGYGEIKLKPNLLVRLGRQELVYDDQRFLGNVDWAVQGRSHELALLKYSKGDFKLDFGVAMNQDADSLTGRTYMQQGNYKNMQLLWMNKSWKYLNASFLFLNNGLQYLDIVDFTKNEVRYSQTAGSHLKYKKNKLKLNSNIYYQFGNDLNENQISAYLLGLEGIYSNIEKLDFTLGGELQSGNDEGGIKNKKNNAFSPLYGTNHKFNGYMDYFYVGNHMNSVGLLDLYFKTKMKINDKSIVSIDLHQFNAPAEFKGNAFESLGTEIDLVYSYNFDKDLNIKFGYSHLFAQKGMEWIKFSKDYKINYFAYLIVTFKPNLFKSEIK